MEPEPPAGSIDFATVATLLRQQWRLIVGCIVAALVIAAVYLNLATYRYSIEMRVAPTANGSADGVSSKLSQLGGLAAVAGVSLPDAGGAGTFKLYVEALHSRDVAEVLARDPAILHGVFPHEWDAHTHSWRVPAGALHDLTTAVKPLLGIPALPFAPPGPARLQQWMTEQVGVDQNLKTPVVTVMLMSDNPAFAVRFLDQLNITADTLLRQRALLRTDDYIRYLSARLPTVTLAEQRVAIAQALGEQERLKMAASSTRPFAADVFEHPAASDRPVTPVPVRVLGIALVLGTVLGVALALMLRRPERTMRTGDL
jgi:hypothetical protein